MIYFPPIVEFSVVGVFDPGVPNQERIVMRPTQKINLGNFGLMVAVESESEDSLRPVNNQFMWLGDVEVEPPSWVIIYTGPGEDRRSRLPDRDESAIVLHWGQRQTVFVNDRIRPVFFRIGSVLISEDTIDSAGRRLEEGTR